MKSAINFVLGALICAAAVTLTGCDEPQKPAVKTPPVAARKDPNQGTPHRFVLTKWDGGVAFDTQTGQICRTWDWQPGGEPAKPYPNGRIPQRSYGEFSPTCESLYRENPSSGAIAVVAESDQDGGQ